MDDQLLPWLRTQIAEVEADAATRLHHRRLDMLAQCEAHTALLDLHRPVRENDVDGDLVCPVCVYVGTDQDAGGSRFRYREHSDWPCATVLAVALAYQHNPGYQEAWRP